MRRLILAAALTMATIAPAWAQGGPVRHAILLAIDASDNVIAMQATMGGLLARLSGRDEEPTERGFFNRFILADTNPEVDVVIYVGYEVGIGPNVLALMEQLPFQITIQSEFAGPITRAEILQRLRNRAINDGIERVWDVRQATRTDGLLVGKFKDVREP